MGVQRASGTGLAAARVRRPAGGHSLSHLSDLQTTVSSLRLHLPLPNTSLVDPTTIRKRSHHIHSPRDRLVKGLHAPSTTAEHRTARTIFNSNSTILTRSQWLIQSPRSSSPRRRPQQTKRWVKPRRTAATRLLREALRTSSPLCPPEPRFWSELNRTSYVAQRSIANIACVQLPPLSYRRTVCWPG